MRERDQERERERERESERPRERELEREWGSEAYGAPVMASCIIYEA